MTNAPIVNPHDQLFKETFSRTETAAAFFQGYLPEAIGSRLSWATLQLQPGQFVDEELRGQQSDLLYSVQLAHSPVLLYCLFEHQSNPDPWMPLRLLRYVLGIWEQYRKQNPKAEKLPPVLPLVLFQGGAKWTADLRLSGLIELPESVAPVLAEFQPDFRHLLVDLTGINADALQGTLIGRAVLMAMKASREGLRQELPRIFRLLAEILRRDDSPSMIRALLRYICAVDNNSNLAEYVRLLKENSAPRLEEEIMTIAEQLKKEGRQEGRQEALRTDVLEILELRFHSVSFSIKRQLAEINDDATLRRFLRLAVQAESVDAFIQGMSR